MTAITIPDVPDLDKWQGGSAIIFKPNVEMLVANLRKASEEYATIREAESRAETELTESDHPAAVEFRTVKESVDTKVSAIDAELEAAIKAAKDHAKERKAKANEVLNTARKSALETVTGVVMGDVTATETVKVYTETVDLLKTTAAALKNELPQLAEWVKALPSPVKQAKGESSAAAPRGFTPRLAYGAVDDKEIAEATFTKIAKFLGIKGDGRKFLIDQLLGAVGSPDNFSDTTDTTFMVRVNDVDHKVTVRRSVPKSKTESVEAAAE